MFSPQFSTPQSNRKSLRRDQRSWSQRRLSRSQEGKAGDVVLSHRVSSAVPSALRGLTTVFGMGTGVALALSSPARRVANSGDWDRQEFRRASQNARKNGRLSGISRRTDQASRAISTARLRMLPCLHLRPIDVLISNGAYESFRSGKIRLGGGFPLRCFQRFSRPNVATRRYPWQNSRYTRGQSVPVLSY